jgi:hypothetical protein
MKQEECRRHKQRPVGIAGRVCLLLLVLLHSAFCLCAQGQYSIDWSSINGGGGTSTGGVYSVSGTIGQPDAGRMSGGNFTLDGGFWGLIAAVPTPGAPYLWVARTPTNTVIVWWARPATSWQLQATTNLLTAGSTWTPCAHTTNEANCIYIESAPWGRKFYRLKQ